MSVANEGSKEGQDVLAELAALRAQLVARDKHIEAQDQLMAELKEQNAELMAMLTQLNKQLKKLQEQLGQNSKNSHLPPSSDGPGASTRAPKTKTKGKAKRKRGGQTGHKGHHRQLLPESEVDTLIALFPPVCEGCGDHLPERPDVDARRYQQVDIREHRRYVTEWQRHEVVCDQCGARTRASYDLTTMPTSAFGPCLVAVVSLLTGVYHLSRRQAQSLLLELFDIPISLGALSTLEKRTSDALEPAYEEAKAVVQAAAVKHSDATSWLRAGQLTSLWTLACTAATVYGIFADGCRATIRPFFGASKGILVSDRATVFGFWSMTYRQICFAHLIRKFIAFSERDGPAGKIGFELLEYTSLIFEYWHGYKDGFLTKEELNHWMQPVQRQFEKALEMGQKADIERLSGSCEDILYHKEALWTFLAYEGVEPTNNHAEQELRTFVLWRKNSFGSQSDRGERFAERIMTVARTARKQGRQVLDFIHQSLKASLEGQPAPRLIEG